MIKKILEARWNDMKLYDDENNMRRKHTHTI